MNESKVKQNGLVRTLRRLAVSLLVSVLVFTLAITTFLNSAFFQKKFYSSFIAPAIEEQGLKIDFNGFNYAFPASFSLPSTVIYFHDTAVVRLGRIEVRDIIWSTTLGIDAIELDTIEVLEPVDGPLMRNMVRSVLDTSSNGESGLFALDIATMNFKGISIPFEDSTKGFVAFYLNQLNLDDAVAADSLFSIVKYEGYEINMFSNQMGYRENGNYEFDFLAESPELISIQGLLKGSDTVTDWNGKISIPDDPNLVDRLDEKFWNIFQNASFDYQLSADSAGFMGWLIGGNEAYEIRTKYKQGSTGKYNIEGDIFPKESLYNWPLFEGYEDIFEYVKPNQAEIKVQTDFSDVDWSLKFIDLHSEIVLKSPGINEPVRATILSESIGLGPLQSARAQLSLLPNINAVIQNENYQVLGVFPSLVSNGKEVRGINVSYYHTPSKDTLWLSSLDSNFDVELAANNILGVTKLAGKLNAVSLDVLDPLDTGQVLITDFECTFNEEGIGSLFLGDMLLARPSDMIFLRELHVTHGIASGVRSLELSSDVLNCSMTGHWDFQDLPLIADHVLQDILVQDRKEWIPIDFSFNLHAGDIGWIADLAHIDVFVSEHTRAIGQYSGHDMYWSTELTVPSFSSKNISGYDIMLKGSQQGKDHWSSFQAESIDYEGFKFTEVLVNAEGKNDLRDLALNFSLVDSIASHVNFKGHFFKNQISMDSLSFNIGTSAFSSSRSGSIRWEDSKILADSVGVNGSSGAFWLNGNLISKKSPELAFYISDLDADVLNYIIRNRDFRLSGKLDADLIVAQSFEAPEVLSQLQFEDFGLNDFIYGDFKASTSYTEKEQVYVSGQMRQGNTSSFSFNSRFDLIQNEIDLRVSLDQFAIDPFNPLLDGVLDELRGNILGGVEIYGPLDSYELNGALSLTNGHFTVPVVGSELSTSDVVEITLSKDVISLDTALFVVPGDSTIAKVYGQVYHDRFDSLVFDLKLHSDSILAVNMQRNVDGYFYGTAVVLGDLLLEGPLEQLHLDLVVATKEGTNFKIPLDNPTAVEMPSYIRFTDASLPKPDTIQTKSLEYFTTDIAIRATPEAQVELVLDEVLGDVIKARGSGNLRLKLLEDESLELYGLYTLESGSYLFTLQNIINKQFDVVEGGSILWSGDLYDAEINMDAKYSLSTDLEGLVSNSNYNNENVDVDLIINLSGALMNPDISFSVELPDAPTSYLEELQRHFLNEDAMNYQAFSLLMLGDFYQQDLTVQEGFDLGSSVQSNTSELLVSEFGSWLAAGIGSYIDLELDYSSGLNPYTNLTDPQNNLNLGVGKDFLDGRLSINSSLDIPIGNQGASTLLLGDTELVYSITKDGKIKVRAFNRSNRNDPLMQNSGPYTQGVGILFHKEFEKVIKD